MKQSRRQQHLIKENQKRLKWIAGIVIVVAIIAIFFGAKLIVGFSLLIQGEDQEIKNNTANSQELVAPPEFDEIPNATNAAKLIVSGTAQEKETVIIYINGSKEDTVSVKGNGTFSTSITLEKGKNAIKAKVKTDSTESNFSDESVVSLDTTAPILSVDFPSNGETYHKDNNPLKVRGKTDSNSTVKVNNSNAIVSGDGSYLYSLFLQNGENTISVESIDEAGNSSKSEVKVNYSE